MMKDIGKEVKFAKVSFYMNVQHVWVMMNWKKGVFMFESETGKQSLKESGSMQQVEVRRAKRL